MMTLKQLETFYWVCRLGGFAAAAEHLHSTQSAISMRIQELESSLGVNLFDRSKRTARLTAKGRELVKYAEQLMIVTSEIQQRISDPKTLTGTISLGATELVAISWLPALVAAIHDQCPGIVLNLDVDAAIDQMRKLKRGAIDIALMPGPIDDPGFIQIPIGLVDFAWMASPNLNIPKKTLTPKDLHAWPLLTLAPESVSYKQLDHWFEENEATIDRWDICNSLGVLAALAAAGVGISYLPCGNFIRNIGRDKLKIINVVPKLPGLEYFVVFEKRHAQPESFTIAKLAQEHSGFRMTKQAPRRIKARRA